MRTRRAMGKKCRVRRAMGRRWRRCRRSETYLDAGDAEGHPSVVYFIVGELLQKQWLGVQVDDSTLSSEFDIWARQSLSLESITRDTT